MRLSQRYFFSNILMCQFDSDFGVCEKHECRRGEGQQGESIITGSHQFLNFLNPCGVDLWNKAMRTVTGGFRWRRATKKLWSRQTLERTSCTFSRLLAGRATSTSWFWLSKESTSSSQSGHDILVEKVESLCVEMWKERSDKSNLYRRKSEIRWTRE